MTRQRRKREKGSAVVESAFIFLVLISMLIGIFDFGQFLFVHQALVERARAATRWGAVYGPYNISGIRNQVLYGQATAPLDSRPGYFGLTSSNVVISHTGGFTNANNLTVRIINFPYQMLSPWVGGHFTGPEIRVSTSLGMFAN